MSERATRHNVFRALHETGCFVMPNPWDAGSARYLQELGFKALATTSAGFGFSRGLPDDPRALTINAVFAHIADIVAATSLPVNADFQHGYARSLDRLAEHVRSCVATGVAGLSIEDNTGDPRNPLFEMSEAVDRVRAARAAVDSTGTGVLLTARAECFLVGHPEPLSESIRRLQAYSEAGADVLFAPGPSKPEDIRAIVEAVSPKPVNVLVSANIGLSVAELAGLGVRRISVGSALARAAWGGFIHAARHLAEEGSFAGLNDATPFSELNNLFAKQSPGWVSWPSGMLANRRAICSLFPVPYLEPSVPFLPAPSLYFFLR